MKETELSDYLEKVITGQNRNGKIASGVAFTVTIDVDMSSYNLIINYIDKDNNKSLESSKTEKKKNGDVGTVICPGIKDYTRERSSIEYEIKDKDVTVDCYYTKNIVVDNVLGEDDTSSDDDSNE